MLKCLVNERVYINCIKIFSSFICKKLMIGMVEEMFSQQFQCFHIKIYPLYNFMNIQCDFKKPNFLFDCCFRFTKKLPRCYMYSTSSPIANILHYSGAFVSTNELILINYYRLKLTLHPDFSSFFLMEFFSVPGCHPRQHIYIYSSISFKTCLG